MKTFFNEHWEAIQKFLGIGLLLVVLHRIAKIWKGPDGKFQVKEFTQFAAFLIFTSLAIYMIIKEANRNHEWHLFDAVYIFIVFGSLLSVLHMDHVITSLTKIFELVIRLRMKGPVAPETKKDETVPQTPSL